MITVRQRKKIVIDFLEKCNRYALEKLDGYRRQQSVKPSMPSLDLDAKITRWSAYYAFNEFALEELRSTELDDWFDENDGL